MTDPTLCVLFTSLSAMSTGALLWSICEQRREQSQRRALTVELAKEREAWTDLLAKAGAANETLGTELARQRDQLASLEMRLMAAPSRGFTQPR